MKAEKFIIMLPDGRAYDVFESDAVFDPPKRPLGFMSIGSKKEFLEFAAAVASIHSRSRKKPKNVQV